MTAERLPDPSRLQSFPLALWYCEAGETHYVKTVSDDYKGIFTHYKRRSEYCPGEVCNCPLKRLRRVWYAYAAVERWEPRSKLWVPAVMQITEALEHDFNGVFKRGQVWEVSRRKGDENKKNYPVVGKLQQELDPVQVPPPFPILPTMQRAYHISHFDAWQPNPVPKPTRVAMFKSAPLGGEEGPKPDTAPTPEQFQAIRDRARQFGRMPNGTTDHARNGTNGQ